MDTLSDVPPERTSERFSVDIRVDCVTRDMFVSNRVTNISRGGLFIASDRPLPISSRVRLKLSLGDSVTIEAQGRVIWNYDIPKGSSQVIPGSGIKFLDLSPEHAARLERYLDDLASPRGN